MHLTSSLRLLLCTPAILLITMELLLQTIHMPWSRRQPRPSAPAPSTSSPRALALTFEHPLGISEWRCLGKELVDLMAEYYEVLLGVQGHTPPPVMSAAQPGFLRRVLPPAAPEGPDGFAAVLRDIRAHILPGITHWQSPSFFSYFPCNTSIASMLADIVVSGLGVLGFQWTSSPACTEMEEIALDWLAQLLHLPPCFLSTAPASGSVLPGTASEAVLVSLLAAKARCMAGRPFEDVLRLAVYATDQTHSCMQKACMVAGIPHLRLIRTRPQECYSLQPEALEAAVQADLAQGLLPCFLCATIGTTSSCAVDPVAELAEVASRHGIWMHVDAAWAGVFALLPEQRELYFGGLEGADSLELNPHKGLLTGWECSALYVKDAVWVKRALKVTPAYLDNPGVTATTNSSSSSGGVSSGRAANCVNGDEGSGSGLGSGPGAGAGALRSLTSTRMCPAAGDGQGQGLGYSRGRSAPTEYKDLDVPLGHGRFRGLRLWIVMRLYGADRLRSLMRHRLRLQDFFADLVRADPRFEMVQGAPPRFGLVCFRLRGNSSGGCACEGDGLSEEHPGCTCHTRACDEGDRLSEALVEAVNKSGAAMLSHTLLSGRYNIRCAIGGTHTQGRHVEAAWHAIQRCATDLLAAQPRLADGKEVSDGLAAGLIISQIGSSCGRPAVNK